MPLVLKEENKNNWLRRARKWLCRFPFLLMRRTRNTYGLRDYIVTSPNLNYFGFYGTFVR